MSLVITPPARSSAQEAAAIAAAIATEVTNRNTAISASGLQWDDMIEPVVPIRTAGTTTTAAHTANTVYLWRFRVDRAFTVTNMSIYVAGTKAGHIDLGIYTKTGSTWDRVAHTGDYDIATSGTINVVNAIPLTATYPLVPGTDYWAAFGSTDNTLTVLRGTTMVTAAAVLIANNSILKAAVYSSGLPATITSPSGNTLPIWMALT